MSESENRALEMVNRVVDRMDSGALSTEVLEDLRDYADRYGDAALVPVVEALSSADLVDLLSAVDPNDDHPLVTVLDVERVADLAVLSQSQGHPWHDWFLLKWNASDEEKQSGLLESLANHPSGLPLMESWLEDRFPPRRLLFFWANGYLFDEWEKDDSEASEESWIEREKTEEESSSVWQKTGANLLHNLFRPGSAVLDRLIVRYGQAGGRKGIEQAIGRAEAWSDADMGLPSVEDVLSVTELANQEAETDVDAEDGEYGWLFRLRVDYPEPFTDWVLSAMRTLRREVCIAALEALKSHPSMGKEV